MTYTRAIGVTCNKVIRLIVHGLALSKIHPNVLTFLGLVINIGAAVLLAAGRFRWAGVVILGAGLFISLNAQTCREHPHAIMCCTQAAKACQAAVLPIGIRVSNTTVRKRLAQSVARWIRCIDHRS